MNAPPSLPSVSPIRSGGCGQCDVSSALSGGDQEREYYRTHHGGSPQLHPQDTLVLLTRLVAVRTAESTGSRFSSGILL